MRVEVRDRVRLAAEVSTQIDGARIEPECVPAFGEPT